MIPSPSLIAEVESLFCGPRAPHGRYTLPAGEPGEVIIPDTLYRFRLLDEDRQAVTLQLYKGIKTLGGALWTREIRALLRVSSRCVVADRRAGDLAVPRGPARLRAGDRIGAPVADAAALGNPALLSALARIEEAMEHLPKKWRVTAKSSEWHDTRRVFFVGPANDRTKDWRVYGTPIRNSKVAKSTDHFGKKRWAIGKMANHRREAVLEEIAKCDLVCCVCHRIRTTKRRETSKTCKYAQFVAWLAELKAKPCLDCGQSYHAVAMDFDHINEDKACQVRVGLRQLSPHAYLRPPTSIGCLAYQTMKP